MGAVSLTISEPDIFSIDYYNLVDFASRYLENQGLISFSRLVRARTSVVRDETIEAIWGEGGHREAIDAFLSSWWTETFVAGEESVVASWHAGIFGFFIFMRHDQHIVCFCGDYAFRVHGIDDETEEELAVYLGKPLEEYERYDSDEYEEDQEEDRNRPRYIATVILPCEDRIVFADSVGARPTVDVGTQEDMLERLRQAQDRGMYFSTAQQFERVSAEVRAAYQRPREEYLFPDGTTWKAVIERV